MLTKIIQRAGLTIILVGGGSGGGGGGGGKSRDLHMTVLIDHRGTKRDQVEYTAGTADEIRMR